MDKTLILYIVLLDKLYILILKFIKNIISIIFFFIFCLLLYFRFCKRHSLKQNISPSATHPPLLKEAALFNFKGSPFRRAVTIVTERLFFYFFHNSFATIFILYSHIFYLYNLLFSNKINNLFHYYFLSI